MATTRAQQILRRALRRPVNVPLWHCQQSTRSISAAAETHQLEPLRSERKEVPPEHMSRYAKIRDTRPFSDFLTDTFNRQHDYLRISLTERCNLRCLYCMPEEGVQLSPSKDILTTAEIYYLSALFVNQGVSKIRLTGGEPTVRKDIVPLMKQIGSLRSNGLKELAITTNGISLHRKLDDMVAAGLTGVNISLDTLDPFQFQLLTRRQGFEAVMKSIKRVQEMNRIGASIKLKINCVAMRGLNDHQIIPFVEMTREQDVEVRFIEYMPFGGNKWSQNKMLPYAEMLDLIRAQYPSLTRLKDARNETSKTWHVPGFQGRVGFITSMTHNFCGTCNRLRITSDGNLKVCLHGNAEVSLRDILRHDHRGEPMDEAAFEAVRKIETERRRQSAGKLQLDGEEGWITKERQLLEVIGAAVKRKKQKHAGMGELENMQNRPMILIGSTKSATKSYGGRLFSHRHSPQRLAPWSSSAVPTHLLSPFTARSEIRSCHASASGTPPTKAAAEPEPTPSETTTHTAKLTHVTSSGEAHMVDVGAKPASRRVAIAIAHVAFSNAAPATLIAENRARKGDVLGVARIAGIMAAKRAADLIPLCHPLALSRVELDVELVAAGSAGALWWSEAAAATAAPQNAFGLVAVQARAECVGPTGVEMEALTAAAAAALTVFDMCKAVDRHAAVQGARVVYKSGGKSGAHAFGPWVEHGGREYLVQNGLDTV